MDATRPASRPNGIDLGCGFQSSRSVRHTFDGAARPLRFAAEFIQEELREFHAAILNTDQSHGYNHGSEISAESHG